MAKFIDDVMGKIEEGINSAREYFAHVLENQALKLNIAQEKIKENSESKIEFRDPGYGLSTTSSKDLAQQMDIMLENLSIVFSESDNLGIFNGPIYSPWIKFSITSDYADSTTGNSIVFDTSSTNYSENIITNLHVIKSRNGHCCEFTLTVKYDPFKNGQDSDLEVLETMDSMIAMLMVNGASLAVNIGKIQYGYNSLNSGDNSFVSPVYSYYLSSADSSTDSSTGITEYKFEGVASIGADCNFETSIESMTDRPLNIVMKVLHKYYGKPGTTILGVTADENALGYDILIDDALLAEQLGDEVTPTVNGVKISPWQYCESVLEEFPLNETEYQSGNFTADKIKNGEVNYTDIPRYVMYETEEDGKKAIRVEHFSSMNTENMTKIDYVFTWSQQNKTTNIVTGWSPSVSLYQYLIRASLHRRDIETIEVLNKTQLDEFYDATIETIGIPCEIPIGAYVRVIPRVLETVSRTSGTYIILGAEDDISTNGIFKTTMQLQRIGSIQYYDELVDVVNAETRHKESKAVDSESGELKSAVVEGAKTIQKTIEEAKENIKQSLINAWKSLFNNKSDGDGNGGGFSDGGGNRSEAEEAQEVDK